MRECHRRVMFQASPNIALIKYWGKTDHALNLPMNASLSLPLGDLFCRVCVWPHTHDDWLGDVSMFPSNAKNRILRFVEGIRARFADLPYVCGTAQANFPSGCGIASSAAFFAALGSALLSLLGVEDEKTRSQVARIGSGSATRSVLPGVWCGWLSGTHETSFGYGLPNCELPMGWVDQVLVFDVKHKDLPSRSGHRLMDHSPLRKTRSYRANLRFVEMCRHVQNRNWTRVCDIAVEECIDFVSLIEGHTVDARYLNVEARAIIQKLKTLYRRGGSEPWMFTVDAGSSIHVIGRESVVEDVLMEIGASPLIKLCSGIQGGGVHEITGADVTNHISKPLVGTTVPYETQIGRLRGEF